MREDFLSERGITLRVWECSLMGCVGTGSEPAGNAFVQQCVIKEMRAGVRSLQGLGGERHTVGKPASYLRWDLPAAIFVGGRCVSPAGSEWFLYAKPQGENGHDVNGWHREGFVESNVTQTGVGWVFADIPAEHREAAFAHDAWTGDSQMSGTHSDLRLKECRVRSTSMDYVRARLAARRNRADAFTSLPDRQRLAASWKWRFANTSHNCFQRRWKLMFDQQRGFAMKMAKIKSSTNASVSSLRLTDCSLYGSLYNQGAPPETDRSQNLTNRMRE